MSLIQLAEKRIFPDFLVRFGIRRLLRMRLEELHCPDPEGEQTNLQNYVDKLLKKPIAEKMDKANEQHYEVPSEFYKLCLGDHLKYSSCYFKTFNETLSEAEANMLALTCERAELRDNMNILELGCGWGSLTLWMAKNYPNSKITGVSNSHSQREWILSQAKERDLNNVEIITKDMNKFEIDQTFDRVISVEMFEHMQNYEALLQKVSGWLKEKGKLFVHIFTHQTYAYPFEEEGDDNWMGKYFFSGGQMPSDHLLFYFSKHMAVSNMWVVSGKHYQQTAELWLKNIDNHSSKVLDIFKHTYPENESRIWLQRWRIFFMACAELWGFKKGREWRVCHYLFEKQTTRSEIRSSQEKTESEASIA